MQRPRFHQSSEEWIFVFMKYHQSSEGIFLTVLLHCFVKHVLCVFSQNAVKCKCHVVYFKMLPVDAGEERSVLVAELTDYYSSNF